ncbi:MAG: glycosyltransferase [Bacteroidia bacterium]|nr:glycosyltransferase [Bacteroidia bacterium]
MIMAGNPKTILVSPLEWGLGHTVRLVPFIRKAICEGHRVILASDGDSLNFLRYHFQYLPWIRMPFYKVRYPDSGRFFRKLIPQVPGILRAIRNNNKQVDEIVSKYNVSEIICDHRYGLHHKDVHSIFITNQLWMKAPKGWSFGEGFMYLLHRIVLRKFSEIWIADYSGQPNLSGILTHPPHLPGNAKYIGPVSRFQGVAPACPDFSKPFEVLALVSGPEPQRTLFENLLKQRFTRNGTPSVIFRGLPPSFPDQNPTITEEGPVLLIDHAIDEHIAWYILNAQAIICRPGSSTLSDLTYLGKTALLVPTPGQTEQEYVAAHLEKQGLFRVCGQDELVPHPR